MEGESSLTSSESFPPSSFQLNASDHQITTAINETQQMSSTRQRDEELAKVEMGVLSAIFILTLLGNLIVILGIYFRRQKMSRMYYFILHLSIADLVTAFFNVGSQFVMELTFPKFIGNNFLCKFVKFTQILGPYSSSYLLVMTAIDRYQVICYPLSNCTWTARQSKMMLAIAWLISCLFCVPQLFIFSLQDVMGHPDCWASFPAGAQEVYVTWYAISFFIVPLLILIFSYTSICRTIWTNFSMKTAATKQGYEGSGKGQRSHEPETQICDEEDAVFTNMEQGSENGLLCVVNNKDASKQLEISWQLDRKGNISTVSGHPTEDGVNLTSETLPAGEDVEDELVNDTPILQNARNGGPAIGFSVHPNLQKFRPKDLESKPKSGTNAINVQKIGAKKKSSHLMIPSKGQISRAKVPNIRVSKNDANGSRGKFSAQKQLLTNDSTSQPRSSSVQGISRAKIKTVKLTVTVICCYIICSSPFITAQLWVTFDPNAYQSKFYTGTTFTILTLLASLNSCVNPWIFLFFNPNLLQDFLRGIRCKWPMNKFRQQPSGGSPVTQKTSPGQFRSNGSSFNSARGHHFVHQVSARSTAMNSSTGSSSRRLPSSSTHLEKERRSVSSSTPSVLL